MTLSPTSGPNVGNHRLENNPPPAPIQHSPAAAMTNEPALLRELYAALRDARAAATTAPTGGAIDYQQVLQDYDKILRPFCNKLASANLTEPQLGSALGKICEDLGFLINFSAVELSHRTQFRSLAVKTLEAAERVAPNSLTDPKTVGRAVLALQLVLASTPDMQEEVLRLATRWPPATEPAALSLVKRLVGLAMTADIATQGAGAAAASCLGEAFIQAQALPESGWTRWNRFLHLFWSASGDQQYPRLLRAQDRIDAFMSIALACEDMSCEHARTLRPKALALTKAALNSVPTSGLGYEIIATLAKPETWQERKLVLTELKTDLRDSLLGGKLPNDQTITQLAGRV